MEGERERGRICANDFVEALDPKVPHQTTSFELLSYVIS